MGDQASLPGTFAHHSINTGTIGGRPKSLFVDPLAYAARGITVKPSSVWRVRTEPALTSFAASRTNHRQK